MHPDQAVGSRLDPLVARLNPTGPVRVVQPLGVGIAVKGHFFRFGRWEFSQGRGVDFADRRKGGIGSGRPQQLPIRQLQHQGVGVLHTIDLQPVGIKGRRIGEAEFAPLEAIGEGLIHAHIQDRPRFSVVV